MRGQTENKQQREHIEYNCEVTHAKYFGEDKAFFDMTVNGVSISGMYAQDYTTKEGQPGTLIGFPAKKGKDGKFYNQAWFPISRELRDEILKKVYAKADEGAE